MLDTINTFYAAAAFIVGGSLASVFSKSLVQSLRYYIFATFAVVMLFIVQVNLVYAVIYLVFLGLVAYVTYGIVAKKIDFHQFRCSGRPRITSLLIIFSIVFIIGKHLLDQSDQLITEQLRDVGEIQNSLGHGNWGQNLFWASLFSVMIFSTYASLQVMLSRISAAKRAKKVEGGGDA